jgi:hypothetical protein
VGLVRHPPRRCLARDGSPRTAPGIAEKVPKKVFDDGARRQIIALESRRVRKRR